MFFRAVLPGFIYVKGVRPRLWSVDGNHSLMKGRSRLTRHEAGVVSRRLVGPLVDSVLLPRWGI